MMKRPRIKRFATHKDDSGQRVCLGWDDRASKYFITVKNRVEGDCDLILLRKDDDLSELAKYRISKESA